MMLGKLAATLGGRTVHTSRSLSTLVVPIELISDTL